VQGDELHPQQNAGCGGEVSQMNEYSKLALILDRVRRGFRILDVRLIR